MTYTILPEVTLRPTGAVVWLTGVAGGGKTTIAQLVVQRLRDRGLPVELLDGGEVRQNLSRRLGFAQRDRAEHVRRIGYVAELLSRNGVSVVCAAVSPHRAARDELRACLGAFVEVYVDCPLRVAEGRGRMALYADARAGRVRHVAGVDIPYEPPHRPEVHLRTDRLTALQSAEAIVEALEALGHLPPDDRAVRHRLAGLGYV